MHFVLHRTEEWKTTNTGHLAHKLLVNTSLSGFQSRVEPPEPVFELDPAEDCFLLFPAEDGEGALPAEELATRERPATVVVLDGTWAQARRMQRNVPYVRGLRKVALPAYAKPDLGLRNETTATGMATITAVAWLLRAAEGGERGEAVFARLMEAHRVMVERVMASRGTPVAGGPTWVELVPREWLH